jgi:hypothetical protein
MNAFPHPRGCLKFVLLLCALSGLARAADPECSPAPADDLTPLATDPPGTVRWSGCRMAVAANGDTGIDGDVAVSVDGKQIRCDHLGYLADTQELERGQGAVKMRVKIIGDVITVT